MNVFEFFLKLDSRERVILMLLIAGLFVCAALVTSDITTNGCPPVGG